MQRRCGCCVCDLLAETKEILSICPSVMGGLGCCPRTQRFSGILKSPYISQWCSLLPKNNSKPCVQHATEDSLHASCGLKQKRCSKFSLDFFLTQACCVKNPNAVSHFTSIYPVFGAIQANFHHLLFHPCDLQLFLQQENLSNISLRCFPAQSFHLSETHLSALSALCCVLGKDYGRLHLTGSFSSSL